MQIMVVLRLTLTESTIILIEYGYKDSADVMLMAFKMTIIKT
jgi:hypothetical protein